MQYFVLLALALNPIKDRRDPSLSKHLRVQFGTYLNLIHLRLGIFVGVLEYRPFIQYHVQIQHNAVAETDLLCYPPQGLLDRLRAGMCTNSSHNWRILTTNRSS